MRLIQQEGRWWLVRPGMPEGRCVEEMAERCGFRVGQMVQELGCCPTYLRRVFLRDTGCGPKRWMQELRLQRVREQLEAGAAKAEVAVRLGFSCHASLRRAIRRN